MTLTLIFFLLRYHFSVPRDQRKKGGNFAHKTWRDFGGAQTKRKSTKTMASVGMFLRKRALFLCWLMALYGSVSAFAPPLTRSSFQGTSFVLRNGPPPSKQQGQSSSSLQMFLGSDGGLLGVGAPEVVSFLTNYRFPLYLACTLSMYTHLQSSRSLLGDNFIGGLLCLGTIGFIQTHERNWKGHSKLSHPFVGCHENV